MGTTQRAWPLPGLLHRGKTEDVPNAVHTLIRDAYTVLSRRLKGILAGFKYLDHPTGYEVPARVSQSVTIGHHERGTTT